VLLTRVLNFVEFLGALEWCGLRATSRAGQAVGPWIYVKESERGHPINHFRFVSRLQYGSKPHQRLVFHGQPMPRVDGGVRAAQRFACADEGAGNPARRAFGREGKGRDQTPLRAPAAGIGRHHGPEQRREEFAHGVQAHVVVQIEVPVHGVIGVQGHGRIHVGDGIAERHGPAGEKDVPPG